MTNVKGLSAAVGYGLISISITFFNKAVLSLYSFNYPNLITLLQMLLSLLFLWGSKKASLINYTEFEWKVAKQMVPLASSFMLMVLTGIAGLFYLNVPMYSALRRVTTLIVMLVDYKLRGTVESFPVQMSVAVMVIGAIIAGFTDLTFNLMGYVLTGLNCIFTAAYLVFVSKLSKAGHNSWTLMYYNNVLAIPFVLVLCVVSDELSQVSHYEHLFDLGFQVNLVISAAQAFLLNYSIFLCTSLNSPLTTSVVGQIKNVVTTAFGMFIFGDVIFDAVNTAAIGLGTLASGWYSWLKYEEQISKEQQKGQQQVDLEMNVKTKANKV